MRGEPAPHREDIPGLGAAPGGLCVVQALINSALPMRPDLLDRVDSAQEWLDEALLTWARQTDQPRTSLRLARSDLAALRDLRGEARGWLDGSGRDQTRLPVTVTVWVEGGRAAYRPGPDGADGVRALVGTELLLASATGTLARLKTCGNPACRAAFYDLSRNSSRVWHDVKTCGNVANLRASRARRRPPGADR